MSKSNYLENAILNLLFNGTSITGLAEDQVTTPLTNLWVSLHTDAGVIDDTSTAVTNEAAYGNYAREPLIRGTDWSTSTTGSISPIANIDFTPAVSGTETITQFAIVDSASGAGNILYYGTVTPNISVTSGVTPRLTTATAITEA